MFVTAGRRLVSLLVCCFAVLGFLAVPIGDKTGYQHVRALLATEEAETLGDTLRALTEQLKETLLGELGQVGAVKEDRSDGDCSHCVQSLSSSSAK